MHDMHLLLHGLLVLLGADRRHATPRRDVIRFAIVPGWKLLASTGIDNDVSSVPYTFPDRFILTGIMLVWLSIFWTLAEPSPEFCGMYRIHPESEQHLSSGVMSISRRDFLDTDTRNTRRGPVQASRESRQAQTGRPATI